MKVKFKNYECKVKFGVYGYSLNTAIQLMGVEGMSYANQLVATASVNQGVRLREDLVAIKEWSENTGMTQALIDATVIQPAVKHVFDSGYVQIKVYQLTPEALAELRKQMSVTHG